MENSINLFKYLKLVSQPKRVKSTAIASQILKDGTIPSIMDKGLCYEAC